MWTLLARCRFLHAPVYEFGNIKFPFLDAINKGFPSSLEKRRVYIKIVANIRRNEPQSAARCNAMCDPRTIRATLCSKSFAPEPRHINFLCVAQKNWYSVALARVSPQSCMCNGWALKLQIESWSWRLTLKVEVESWKGEFKLKVEVESWSWKSRWKVEVQTSTSTSNLNFQLQLSTSTFNFNFQLRLPSSTSNFNFQLPLAIWTFNSKFQLPVSTWTFNLKVQVETWSWNLKLKVQVET